MSDRKTRQGFLIFHDLFDLLAEMPAESVKSALLAAGEYSKKTSSGEEPEEPNFKGLERVAYLRLKDGVKYSNYKYLRSAAYNRAKRLQLKEPQKLSFHQLNKLGFTIMDISILKEADEEEVRAALEQPEGEQEQQIENENVRTLVADFLAKDMRCTRSELEEYVRTCIDHGAEEKLRTALEHTTRGMSIDDLKAYVKHAK